MNNQLKKVGLLYNEYTIDVYLIQSNINILCVNDQRLQRNGDILILKSVREVHSSVLTQHKTWNS